MSAPTSIDDANRPSAAPPAYDNGGYVVAPPEKALSSQPVSAAAPSTTGASNALGTPTTTGTPLSASTATDKPGVPSKSMRHTTLHEIIDVTRDEVQLTMSFFAIPWASLVILFRLVNWLWGVTFSAPLVLHPQNILFAIAGPVLVFHAAMVIIVLAAEESR